MTQCDVTVCRRDCGATTDFPLDSPATVERIRMACADNIAEVRANTPSFLKWVWTRVTVELSCAV